MLRSKAKPFHLHPYIPEQQKAREDAERAVADSSRLVRPAVGYEKAVSGVYKGISFRYRAPYSKRSPPPLGVMGPELVPSSSWASSRARDRPDELVYLFFRDHERRREVRDHSEMRPQNSRVGSLAYRPKVK
jgi:hypothetical protein